MSKLRVLPIAVLVFLAGSATASARDRDHDGLPDRWERRHELSTSKKSAKGDPDHDELSNLREYRLRTDPQQSDSDGDGYEDRLEVQAGTDPRDAASHPSTPPPPPPDGDQFPNRATTGVPNGWVPTQTRSTNLTITQAGAIVEDIRFTQGADLRVLAPNVTARRLDFEGGVITNQSGSTCGTGLTVEDTTFEPVEGTPYTPDAEAVLGEGAYTARRVEIWKRGEGFRLSDCGRVTIEDSFAYIQGDTADCDRDLHSDGIQGYYAKGLTLENASIIFGNDCGTSPYFVGYGPGYPSRPPINTGTYDVDHLLVSGGGYVFRHQVPGSVNGLRIVNNSWVFGPIDNACSVISPWDAKIVNIDSSYRVTEIVRNQPCNTEAHD